MLKVGSDCSGICSEIQALQALNIPFKHRFVCEIDPFCRGSIEANYSPKYIFKDITTRDHSLLPDIDLYVAGFPCQPFSNAGLKKGMEDPRSSIFYHVIKTIKAKLPRYFVLENVKGVLKVDKIVKKCKRLEKLGYNVTFLTLNAKDFGSPQNRERVFIVGSMEGIISCKDLEKKPLPSLKKFVDWKDRVKSETKRVIPHFERAIFVDLNFLRDRTYPNAHLFSPALNCGTGLFCLPLKRFANTKERLKLQGFSPSFKVVVSKTQIRKQLGNAINVCVLKAIFKVLLSSY